jgi:hypothetical protein
VQVLAGSARVVVMPVWTPTEDWKGQDVFIIGGGSSLRGFDWTRLHSELTIGCNTAFTLGSQVCKVCVFGDPAWFEKFKGDLEGYRGKVFTNAPSFLTGPLSKIPWVWTMPRSPRGLHRESLGWNGHTGSIAINLALLLGAKRVFLLGFDMKHIQGKSNWHDYIIRPYAIRPVVYRSFVRDFREIMKGWKQNFSDREIWNVTADSDLPATMIPWWSPESFWRDRGVPVSDRLERVGA